MELKRVVVTGLGALTPVGNTVSETWNNLLAGVSGAAPITHFDASKYRTQFACEVKNFDPNTILDRKEVRKYDSFSQYAVEVARQAMEDANFDLEAIDKDRVGVVWGAGIGGLKSFQDEISAAANSDVPRYNPFFIPKMIADMAAGHIAIAYGFRGPNYATVSACASSTNAVADAFNLIRLG
ncbi:MAG: beta-ketoacyl-[Paludibacteraceae bacterium]|nr:beta-ketoacyl-[acyl-carrier-protein] synthase II [Paludibacteraceae bacterium]